MEYQSYFKQGDIVIRLFVGSIAFIALISHSVIAADMTLKAPPPPPASYSWTGFYLGVNLGGGWAHSADTATFSVPGSGTDIATSTTALSGAVGGGQIGYNWQVARIVLGVEADLDGFGQHASSAFTFSGSDAVVTFTDRVNAFGTVRGRLGFAVDRWMFYGTGGYSWQNIDESSTLGRPGPGVVFPCPCSPVSPVPLASSTNTRSGYVVGGGVETRLWGNWTGGVEYLYLDTGTFTTGTVGPVVAGSPLNFPGGGAPVGTTGVTTERVQNNVIRVRLNYLF